MLAEIFEWLLSFAIAEAVWPLLKRPATSLILALMAFFLPFFGMPELGSLSGFAVVSGEGGELLGGRGLAVGALLAILFGLLVSLAIGLVAQPTRPGPSGEIERWGQLPPAVHAPVIGAAGLAAVLLMALHSHIGTETEGILEAQFGFWAAAVSCVVAGLVAAGRALAPGLLEGAVLKQRQADADLLNQMLIAPVSEETDPPRFLILTTKDGQRVSVAFTSVEALQRWRPGTAWRQVHGKKYMERQALHHTALWLNPGSPDARLIEYAAIPGLAARQVDTEEAKAEL
jgi:hypothetical protein